jgi:hypothetical protein
MVCLGVMLSPGSLAHAQPASGEGGPAGSLVAIPDRSVRSDDLRALQRTLATTTPTTLAAARAELDDLLGGDGSPPFDNATQKRASAQLPLPLAGLIAGASAIAAALGAGLVSILTASRKVASPLDMALENIEAACDRLATVANLATRAQDSIAAAAETAADAAKNSALTVTRLAETASDTQARLRDWLVTADSSQDRAATLANQCTRLTEILPDLLGGAVETMQARGLAAIDGTVAILQETAGAMAATAGGLEDSVAAVTAAVTVQVEAAAAGQRMADGLTRQCQQLGESLPDIIIGAIAPIMVRDKSTLDSLVDRLDQAASVIETSVAALHDGVAGMAVLAADQTVWHESHSAIVRHCERLSSDLPDMASGAVCAIDARSQAALQSIEVGMHQCRLDIEEAATNLRNEVVALAEAACTQSIYGEKTAALAQQCERLAHDLPTLASHAIGTIETQGRAALESVEGRLQDTALGVEAAAASLQESVVGLVDVGAGIVDGVSAVLARAEGFVGLLPEITGNLAGAAATLRREAQHGAQMLEEGGAAVARAAAASTAAAAELPRAAACLDMAAAHIGAAVDDVRDAASALLAREEECNAALAARADAVLGTLPLEASQIAAVAASLRADAADLAAAAWRVEEAAGNQPNVLATLLARPKAELAALCSRLDESVAGLGETSQILRADAERAVGELSGKVQAATDELICAARASALTAIEPSAMRQASADLAWQTQQLADLTARGEETASRMACAVDAVTELPVAVAARLADAVAVSLPKESMLAKSMSESMPESMSESLPGFLPGAVFQLTEQTERLAGLLMAAEQNEARMTMAIETVAGMPATVAARLAAEAGGAWPGAAAEHLAAQTERVASLLSAAEMSAARLIVAAERAANEPAPQTTRGSAVPAHRPPEAWMMHLEATMEATMGAVSGAAARLVERAEAHDQAATRVAQAALEVAAAAAPSATARHLQQLPTLARLSGLAAETQALQTIAGTMAKSAIAGGADGLPPDLVAEAPALLAAIEISIHQLRGTATALAMASDAARQAA